MTHLLIRERIYYYNRRVPSDFAPYDGRKIICFSLKTDSLDQAKRLSALKSAELENYWNSLAASGQKHSDDYFRQTVKRAKIYGFTYIPMNVLADGCVNQLTDRVNYVAENKFTKYQAEAVLGAVSEPEVLLSDALLKFWDIRADIVINKTENEIRKWKNPRRLAVENFITVNGDKSIKEISRDDMLHLRDWWITRIVDDSYSPATANKNFRHVKSIITTVAEHYKIKLEVDQIFGKLEFEDDNYEPRKPFTTDYILNVLFNPKNLIGLKEHEIAMLHVFAETGISISEQTKLLPEDIYLDTPIPYLNVKPRTKMQLKNKHRKRQMPLVGLALDAIKKFPDGFRKYGTNADSITSALNRHFREKSLFPSEKHSIYSLRHSYSDRLINNRCEAKIHDQLMGHRVPGEPYGEGASLETKYEELIKIQLKPVLLEQQ